MFFACMAWRQRWSQRGERCPLHVSCFQSVYLLSASSKKKLGSAVSPPVSHHGLALEVGPILHRHVLAADDVDTASRHADHEEVLGFGVAKGRADHRCIAERRHLNIAAGERDLSIRIAKKLDVLELVLLPKVALHGEIGGVVYLWKVADLDHVLRPDRAERKQRDDNYHPLQRELSCGTLSRRLL